MKEVKWYAKFVLLTLQSRTYPIFYDLTKINCITDSTSFFLIVLNFIRTPLIEIKIVEKQRYYTLTRKIIENMWKYGKI